MVQVHAEGQPRNPIENPGVEEGYLALNPKPDERTKKQSQYAEIKNFLLYDVQRDQQNTCHGNQSPRVSNSDNSLLPCRPEVGNDQPHNQSITVRDRAVEDG